MSILNVAIVDVSPTCYIKHALIAVDTAAVEIDPEGNKRRFLAEKAGVHGGVVAAARGNLDILNLYLSNLRLYRRQRPFHSLVRDLPEHLSTAQRQLTELVGDVPVPEMVASTEFVLAGYDDAKMRVRAVVATYADGGWKVEEVPNDMHGPGVFTPDSAPMIDTPAQMVETAKQQVQLFRQVHPDAPIGGDLIVYKVMPARVEIMNMGSIG